LLVSARRMPNLPEGLTDLCPLDRNGRLAVDLEKGRCPRKCACWALVRRDGLENVQIQRSRKLALVVSDRTHNPCSTATIVAF